MQTATSRERETKSEGEREGGGGNEGGRDAILETRAVQIELHEAE